MQERVVKGSPPRHGPKVTGKPGRQGTSAVFGKSIGDRLNRVREESELLVYDIIRWQGVRSLWWWWKIPP